MPAKCSTSEHILSFIYLFLSPSLLFFPVSLFVVILYFTTAALPSACPPIHT